MIIIKFCGGMGNQMFQIALYKVLEEQGKDVFLDMNTISQYLNARSWSSIIDVFNIKICEASERQIYDLSDSKKDLASKLRRKIFGRRKSHYEEKQTGIFDSKIFELDNVYLDGYWQTNKYFERYKDKILETFKFPDVTDEINKNYLRIIHKSDCSVSMHIRLGDYLELSEKYGGICTTEYYKKAVLYFKMKYVNPTFIIFSNDPESAKQLFNDNSFIFIESNDEKMAWIDMFLMTQCNHNIIANSSFSWWGAWLNQHKNKEVVAPQKWENNALMSDVCPLEWIRL